MENKFSFGFQRSYASESYLFRYFGDKIMMAIFTDFICIFGLVGNGIVLWLFGFRIKRNPFTTYILNLTICDFGFLLFLFLFNIFPMIYIFSVHLDTVILDILLGYDTFLSLLLLMYSSGQFLLTAISLDRCVAVLFPDWYYCHRSPNVSTTVCSLIWVFLFLLCGMQLTLLFTGNNDDFHLMLFYQYFAISSICLLLMTISSLILFIKFHLKLQTCQYGKLLTVILLTLLFALLFSFLTSAFSIAMYLQVGAFELSMYMMMCWSLRSSIHLLIYFLVGRWKVCQFLTSMKATLQRVFKEAEQRPAM